MKVEIDLKRIKKAAEKKENENWEFRSFLKGYDIEVRELDSIVHGLFKEVSREIDCTACGNCCREISPVLERGLRQPAVSRRLPAENASSRILLTSRPTQGISAPTRVLPDRER